MYYVKNVQTFVCFEPQLDGCPSPCKESLMIILTTVHLLVSEKAGADPGFSKRGLKEMPMVMYKLYYIAIIHIIILNKVHYILLKANCRCMNLLVAVPPVQQLYRWL